MKLTEKNILNLAMFENYREVTPGAVDTSSFNGFVVWSESATIEFTKDPLNKSTKATNFTSKTVPGDGKFYPLSGKNMLVTGGNAGDVALSVRESVR